MSIMWAIVGTDAYCEQYDFPCPCKYLIQYNAYEISCYGTPMETVASKFKSIPALKIATLQLFIQTEGDSIPADLLGQSRLTYIPGFNYGGVFTIEPNQPYGNPNRPLLTVDPNAFRFSYQPDLPAVFIFKLRHFDTSRLDFQFLSALENQVLALDFDGLLNLQRSLPTLPYLPALRGIDLWNIDFNNVFPEIPDALKCEGIENLRIYITDGKYVNIHQTTFLLFYAVHIFICVCRKFSKNK